MKIFDERNGWPTKVNFVDSVNHFVGYDLAQQCCEHCGWALSTEPLTALPASEGDNQIVHDDYVFDPDFFATNNYAEPDQYDDQREGTIVTFRLIHPTKPPIFLSLFNAHNGYYGHGFNTDIGGIIPQKDEI